MNLAFLFSNDIPCILIVFFSSTFSPMKNAISVSTWSLLSYVSVSKKNDPFDWPYWLIAENVGLT